MVDQKIDNHLKEGNVQGNYVGGNQTNNYYASMLQDSEREFVVTHNANIKPVSYFIGRATELQELRQRIEEGCKSVLVSGMGGIGKTHICRKLFEEYHKRHAEAGNSPFQHIGYIEYNGDMGSSLQSCLKFKEQDSPEQNQEAAWRELEYLASDGMLLLFVDNVNVAIGEDAGLERLKNIPGAVVLTSRRTSFGKEFEPYRVGFLSAEQCKKVYERIRYDGSDMRVPEKEVADLEYVIDKLAAKHTLTIEFLAHLAQTKHWSVKKLRDELQNKGFCLEYKDDEEKLVNIQKSYEALYDLSKLTEAEQNILEAFSLFPYIPLAAETCNEWLLSDAGVVEDDDILMGLYQKGWLQFDIAQESYALHPVFAQFIYEKCKPKIEKHYKLLGKYIRSKEILDEDSLFNYLQYIPFVESIFTKLDLGIDLPKSAYIYIVARSLLLIANEKEEKAYAQLFDMCKDILDEKLLDALLNFINCVKMHNGQKAKRTAKEFLDKFSNMNESELGKISQSIINCCNNLRQDREEKKEESNESALESCWLYLACRYFNVASFDIKIGDLEASLECYFQIYDKYANVYADELGKDHYIARTAYENMMIIYFIWNPEGDFEQWLEEKMKE